MINSTQRTITALVISLVIQVISLTGLAYAASAPTVTNLDPITDGVIAPVRIAMDGQATSNYYVADPRAGGILKVNGQRKLVGVIRTAKIPKGVAVGVAGNTAGKILVSQGTFVSAYNADGTEALRLGVGTGEFVDADGIAVDAAGYIFVVDSRARAVKVYNANGVISATLTTWTPPVQTPAIPSSFVLPTGISYDPVGQRIAVVDTLAGKVFFFTTSGGTLPVYNTFIGALAPQDGGNNLYFTYPTGVAFEYVAGVMHRVYIVDSFLSQVQVIDPAGAYNNTTGQGTYLSRIGGYGIRKGQLITPFDIIFDGARKLLVATNGNSNLMTFGIDGGGYDTEIAAPGITSNDPPAPNADGTVVVTGTYTNADSITCSVDTAAVSAPAVMNAGAWSCAVSGLVPGTNNVTAQAANGGPNVSTVSEAVVYADPNGSVTILPYQPTNISSILVAGTVTEGASVSVLNQANSNTYPATVAGTTWSAVVTLVEGNNHLVATATKANMATKTAATDVLMDTVPPTLTVSALAGGSSTSTQVQNVTGLAVDAQGSVTVTVNGQPAEMQDDVFSAPVILAAGSNAITVEVTDIAGNKTISMRYVDFDFDATQPVVTATPGDGAVTKLSSTIVSGTTSNADYLTVNGQAVTLEGNGNWSTTVSGLAEGMNTIQIVASKLANGASSTIKRTVFKRTAGPAIALGQPDSDIATNLPTITFSGTAPDAGATLTTTFDNSTVSRTITGGAFTFDLNIPREEGFTVLFTLTDGVNTTTMLRNLVYDSTPPALDVDEHSTKQNIFGTAGVGTSGIQGSAKIEILDNGVTPIGTVTVNQDGSWSADMTGVTYNLTQAVVKATDPAGNSTAKLVAGLASTDGDINDDKLVTIQDALVCLRLIVYNTSPTLSELAHGDLGPLVEGALSPDGYITLPDCMIILQEAVGLPTPLP